MGDSAARTLIIGAACFAVGAFLSQYVLKYYIFPREALARLADQCQVEGDKIYGLEITRWVEENKTDVFNPYRRSRDAFIETCIKADGGWCSITGDAIWPASRPWAFAPRDPFAKLFYDYRYGGGEHVPCAD